jgi:hypothetical protein
MSATDPINIVFLALAMLVLLACEWWGYRRWIKPHETAANRQAKAMLMLIILTLAGGFIGPFSWWADIPNSFAWDPPPLASRMLATAGWCFAFVAYLCLSRPTWRRVRLTLLMLAIYLAPLAIALVLFHLDRLNFAAPITYPFFAVVALLTGGSIWFLIRQPTVIPDTLEDLAPAGRFTQAWLSVVAVVTGVWSLALAATDNGPSPLIWVWPGDLLTSRLIAAMLITITAAAIFSLRHVDTARITTGVTLIYGLGLAIASVWNAFAGKPIPITYLVAFGLIFAGSLAALLMDKRAARAALPAT